MPAFDVGTLSDMTDTLARPVADLVVARAHGDLQVHLAEQGWDQTLCGEVVGALPPSKRFRDAACDTCLTLALHAGQIAAREGDRSWINLLRVWPAAPGRRPPRT